MIYFDNASTTKMDKSVVELICKAYESDFANPSSLHSLGFKLEKKIREARGKIAKQLKIKADNLFFAPSATIANNLVFNSFMKEGNNILTSQVEHSSIAKLLGSKNSTEIRLCKVDEYGFVDREDFLSKIDQNTSLVSIIHVQNELGTINDINELSRLAKEKNPKLFFHSDGVQAFKKTPVDLSGIDFYTIAGHKINGPKGISGLYAKNPKLLKPLYLGGGQEEGIFPGTENSQAIEGFARASGLENNYEKIEKLNKYIRQELGKIPGIRILSPINDVSPYILNFCIEGIGAEVLLHYLEMDEIYISTGSACSKGAESRVLKAIGLSDEELKGCIRISFDRNSSHDEAEIFLGKLKEKIYIIRGILK